VRDLTEAYKTADLAAFAQLVRLLLSSTVAAAGQEANLRVSYLEQSRARATLGGPGAVLRLRDERWLRVAMSLFVDQTSEGKRLKVLQSSFQYQATKDDPSWVFRYDYLRSPGPDVPGAHLQVNGNLMASDALPSKRGLKVVHFPTRRVSLEAVIRLLAVDFKVPCRDEATIWRAVLAEADAGFKEIAHEPEPGF
jgi:hypothetical protein